MKVDIYAGKRILYKSDKQWRAGEIMPDPPQVTDKGLFLVVGSPKEYVEVNDLFLDAIPLEEYYKNDPDIFMTKEKYMDFIESEDFIRGAETAYVSDGEYIYYPINKFNRNWLEKQPFSYVVRVR